SRINPWSGSVTWATTARPPPISTANKWSAIPGAAAAASMSSRNMMAAANASLTARYPNGVTRYVAARNTTATTAADDPVGCQTHVKTDATTTPAAIPATRPTQRV